MKRFIFPILLLLGASSYGVHATIVKLAFNAGYSVPDVTGGQYLFGLFIIAALLPFITLKKMTVKEIFALLLVGMSLSLTGIFYGKSINLNSASMAVLLLFQFSWMGILMESIIERRLPSLAKTVAVLFLVAGTIMAGQFVPGSFTGISKMGLTFGLLSAVSFAFYLLTAGKAAKQIPSLQRSLVMCIGGLLLVFVVFKPSFLTESTLSDGLWPYALIASLLGVVFPIVFFAISAPKVDSGIAVIISGAELPAAILAAALFLGEQITLMQTCGIVLILFGISIPQIKWRKPRQIEVKAH